MPTYVSKSGLAKLNAELKGVQARLAGLRKEKAVAYHESGDTWHDNPYFNSLEQEEGRIANRIKELGELLRDSEIIDTRQRNIETVSLGSIVKIIIYDDDEDDKEQVFEIYGYNESDANNNILAYNSPLGQVLLGMTEGESCSLALRGKKKEIEVIALYPDWESIDK